MPTDRIRQRQFAGGVLFAVPTSLTVDRRLALHHDLGEPNQVLAVSDGRVFFSFDGIDGAGKSTQMQLFVDWLRGRGQDVVTCRDPGSTVLGERLREILLHKSDIPICRRAEMLLYMASRAQLVDEIIQPALQQGKVVVSDRFLLANVVYQGHAGGLTVEDLWQVGEVAIDRVAPARIFVLDMDVGDAVRRMNREPDRMESQGCEFMEAVRQGFLAEARRWSEIVVIDAGRDIQAVQADIRSAADHLLGAASEDSR